MSASVEELAEIEFEAVPLTEEQYRKAPSKEAWQAHLFNVNVALRIIGRTKEQLVDGFEEDGRAEAMQNYIECAENSREMLKLAIEILDAGIARQMIAMAAWCAKDGEGPEDAST